MFMSFKVPRTANFILAGRIISNVVFNNTQFAQPLPPGPKLEETLFRIVVDSPNRTLMPRLKQSPTQTHHMYGHAAEGWWKRPNEMDVHGR